MRRARQGLECLVREGRVVLTCVFAAVPFGIFAKALKNSVDAGFKNAEKEGSDDVGENKYDEARYGCKLFGVGEKICASIKNEE